MNKNKVKTEKRNRRRSKVRARVSGVEKRPRLSVYRSLRGIQVQLIDDTSGRTLVSASSEKLETSNPSTKLGAGKKLDDEKSGKIAKAFAVGELVAKKALDKGIKRVVFDRGGYKYHGRVKAIADGARKGGLKF
ncbi:50S ribosomal protein L18 [Candidatus Falkowbacteria bacterium]|nr:50S ribosomal protein L18 [Candidatus Falkowbacteria bacterium]